MPLVAVSDVDGFAMAMVVILVLSFGIIALLLWSISRNGKRRDREVEDLIEALQRPAEKRKSPASSAAPDTREPWEKDCDWWKT